jgi:hypothetical protein
MVSAIWCYGSARRLRRHPPWCDGWSDFSGPDHRRTGKFLGGRHDWSNFLQWRTNPRDTATHLEEGSPEGMAFRRKGQVVRVQWTTRASTGLPIAPSRFFHVHDDHALRSPGNGCSQTRSSEPGSELNKGIWSSKERRPVTHEEECLIV